MKLKNFERLRAKSIMIDGGFTFAVIFATTHLADLCMKLLGEDILAEKREGLSYHIAWLSISITYMLNKDLINGRSIGKTLANFRVVRISDGLTAVLGGVFLEIYPRCSSRWKLSCFSSVIAGSATIWRTR
jgi:hypothetical protein